MKISNWKNFGLYKNISTPWVLIIYINAMIVICMRSNAYQYRVIWLIKLQIVFPICTAGDKEKQIYTDLYLNSAINHLCGGKKCIPEQICIARNESHSGLYS